MTRSEKVKSLDQAFFDKAATTADQWKRLYRSTDPLNEADVESVINKIYRAGGLEPPAIYYCQSPWQMCLMPTTLVCLYALRGCLSEKLQAPIRDVLISNLSQQCGHRLTESLLSQLEAQVESKGVVDPGHSLWNFFDRKMCDGSGNPERYEHFEYLEPLVNFDASAFYRRIIFERQADIFQVIKEALKSHQPVELWPPVGDEHQDFLKSALIEHLQHPKITLPHYFDSSRSIWFVLILLVQDYINEKCNVGLQLTEETMLMIEAMRNTHMFVPYEKICFVSQRPTSISFQGDGGLHNRTGPAIAYADGFGIYYWRNTPVPREIVEKGGATTYEDIEKQENIELRRAMIEIYGEQRYIIDSNVKPVHKDHYGTLYRRIDPGHDDVVMVKVTNRTREADGSRKEYWLRVPPGVRTAKEAVAWSFYMNEDDYEPEIET